MEITAKFTERHSSALQSSHKSSGAVDTTVLFCALLLGLQKLKRLQLSTTERLTQEEGHFSRVTAAVHGQSRTALWMMAPIQRTSFLVLAVCCTILYHVNAGVIDRTQGKREFLIVLFWFCIFDFGYFAFLQKLNWDCFRVTRISDKNLCVRNSILSQIKKLEYW